MPTYPLTASERAIADSNGVAIARIGPDRAFEKWHVTSVAVQSTSSTLVPELREFRNNPVESALLGTSRSGDLDSGSADIMLGSGEDLVYQWTNCDVGATCIVTVNGTRTLP